MKNMIILLLLIGMMCPVAMAQDFEEPAAPENIASWLDYATYRVGNLPEFSLVEFYYGLLRHQLTYEDKDSFYEATAYIWIEVFDKKGVVVDTFHKKVATRVEDPLDLNKSSFRILDAMQALMKPGEYSIRMTIEDANSRIEMKELTGKYAIRQIKVRVPDYSNDKLMLSDVELAYKIEMLNDADTLMVNPLHKSNRNVIPNPSRIFIDTDSLLYFYAEIYNLKFNKDAQKDYYVSCRIEDRTGAVIGDFGRRKYYKPGSSAVVSSAIDIYDLPEGRFIFVLEVEDSESGDKTTASRVFDILYQSEQIAPAVSEESFTEADAKFMENVIHYFANDTEKRQYKEANLEGKKEVLRRFWQSRDPDPNTHMNEMRVEIFRRFAYSNKNYSVNLIDKSDGWKSDRGRIYIIYGEPDEIERIPSSLRLDPYERWNYYSDPQQGNIYFIFVDEGGYGNYTMRHSNAKGERTDPEWENLLRTSDPFAPGY
jgi:GWxTD domain-containing protein